MGFEFSDDWSRMVSFGRLRPGARPVVVYGGAERQERTAGLVLPWSDPHTVAWS